MKIKRIFAYVIGISFSLGLLSACKSNNTNEVNTDKESNKIKVVTTIFPEYDWVREIVGDKLEDYDMTLLLDNGVDLHSYQPTAEDIAKISESDLFIYVGGESDAWVENILKENKTIKTINLLEVLGDDRVLEEEIVEGMEGHEHDEENETHEAGEHDDDHEDKDHDHEAEAEDDDHDHENDEHVWLSLRNASYLVEVIADNICNIDEENKELYLANAKAYIEKLEKLDKEYEEVVGSAKNKTLLFGDRFPFRYMVEDYGLDYYAAFVGCSAETEASFETVAFLADKLDELNLDKVFIIENSNDKLAKTIISSTKDKNKEILLLNSLQSVDEKDIENGADYYSIMKDNLEVLKKALN